MHKILKIYAIENKIMCKNIYQKTIINTLNNLNNDLVFKNFDRHVLDCDILENHKYYVIR